MLTLLPYPATVPPCWKRPYKRQTVSPRRTCGSQDAVIRLPRRRPPAYRVAHSVWPHARPDARFFTRSRRMPCRVSYPALTTFIDGFGVSSLTEARAARNCARRRGKASPLHGRRAAPRRRGVGGQLRLRDLQLAQPTGTVGPRIRGTRLGRPASESGAFIR